MNDTDMANVFKIRHGKETHVYKADTAPDKKGLLAQLRQVSDELSARKRKEREGEHERRRTMWQSNGDVGFFVDFWNPYLRRG
jgi:exocyst complex component 8